jgi:hypothetical protein
MIDLGDPTIRLLRVRGFRLSVTQYTRKNGELGCVFTARRDHVVLSGRSRDGNRIEALTELGRAATKLLTAEAH